MTNLVEEINKSYQYNALTNLISEHEEIEDYILNIKNGKEDILNIKLCIYEVNTESHYKPFLRFLLNKNYNDELQFFSVNQFQLMLNCKTFLEYLNDYLKLILSNYLVNKDLTYDVKGLIRENNILYLFVDVTKMKLFIDDKYKTNELWFVLMDEIMNVKSVCDMAIHDSVTDFFHCYPEFIFIQDAQNENIEIPMVVYVGKYEKLLEFTYVFGNTKYADEKAVLGPYYYFTDFVTAIRQGGWTEHEKPQLIKDNILITDNEYGRYKKGGIVRIAIFTGNMLVKINDPEDVYDDSEMKKMRLNDKKNNIKYEVLTSRITDYDGRWVDTYDSVYLGKIELDDGSLYKESPMYVVKNFDQQHPLSYHYINKQTLGEIYDKNSNYSIM